MSSSNLLNANELPQHYEINSPSKSPPTQNPNGDAFNVVVTVPESIQIKMVDASALADYEVWIFIASILSSAVVGFLVAYLQAVDAKSPSQAYIGWTCVLFALLFAVASGMATYKRTSLQKKGRDIKLKTTSVSG